MSKLLPIIESPPDHTDQLNTSATGSRPRRGLPSQTALGTHAEDFIDDNHLAGLLLKPADREQVREVIAKSLEKQPLSVAETAVLISATEPELIDEIFEAAQAQAGCLRPPDRAFRSFVHRQLLRERLQLLRVPPVEPSRPFGGRSIWPRYASRSRLSKIAATSG